MDITNIVNGENFKRVANIVITPDTIHLERNYDEYFNIVFCKTDLIEIAFHELSKNSGKNILITHQSDYSITENLYLRKPPSIKKWFGKNIAFKHNDLISIPIGIENHCGADKGLLLDIDFIENLRVDYKPNEKIRKIYCNFNINNHPSRPNVKSILSKYHLSHFDDFGIPSNEFYTNLSKYLFVASPRGNGIDCHRTWETLLMGSIPIVDKNFIFDGYKNLPIIQVDDWEDLFKTDILQEYENQYYKGNLFNNMEEITMDFWIKKIMSQKNII